MYNNKSFLSSNDPSVLKAVHGQPGLVVHSVIKLEIVSVDQIAV